MFSALLDGDDALRATQVVEILLQHGLRGALAGRLAIEAQLRAHGRPFLHRRLNDLDFVVEGLAAIPESLAAAFLQHHVHPEAGEGKTLLQLIDRDRALRVDLFAAFNRTLSRAWQVGGSTGPLTVLAVEDLVARSTAFVCGRLGRGRTIDPKHASSFLRLRGLGQAQRLAEAWDDHRQSVPGNLQQADSEAVRLLESHPELLVADQYSADAPPCPKCRPQGPFRPARRDTIVEILGYC